MEAPGETARTTTTKNERFEERKLGGCCVFGDGVGK
jgi:hypothetical protein